MTATLTIDRNTWIEILSDAAVATIPRQTDIPVLACIHITIDPDGVVTAEATDRFILARRTHRPEKTEDVSGTADFMLHADDLAAMTRTFPKPKRGIPPEPLNVIFEGDKLIIATSAASATYTAQAAEPINIGTLLDGFKPGATGSVYLDPARLAQFVKVAHEPRSEGMRLTFPKPGQRHEVRPVKVEIGAHFVGLICPMRDPS